MFSSHDRRKSRGTGGLCHGSDTEGNADTALAARLFTCVGRSCHGEHPARRFLNALEKAIAAANTDGVQLEIHPCDCLDQCGEGPVIVACTGSADQAALPHLQHHPLGTFRHVTPDQTGPLVNTILNRLRHHRPEKAADDRHEENDAPAFRFGVKRLSDVMLRRRNASLFADFTARFGNFMKTLKS